MQKINFQNLPNTTTPVNATNLNALQENVEDVFDGAVAMGSIKTTGVKINNVDVKNVATLEYEVVDTW